MVFLIHMWEYKKLYPGGEITIWLPLLPRSVCKYYNFRITNLYFCVMFEFVLMNLYTIVSFRRNDSSSDKVSSLAAVATGVGKSNGDEALDDDDGEYEDNEEEDNDDDGDYKEEEKESTSNKTDDNSDGAGALLHEGLHVVQNHNQQRDNLGSNFLGLTSYLALHYEPPLGPFSEYVALCTICFI